MKISKSQIPKILKQKEPFIFIDEAEIIQENKIIAKFNLLENNHILKGHFPNFPIMPGVIAIEMLAQASLLLHASNQNLLADDYYTYFVKVENFNFKGFIQPPATLEIRAETNPTLMENYSEINGSIFQDGKRKCYGKIICYLKEERDNNE